MKSKTNFQPLLPLSSSRHGSWRKVELVTHTLNTTHGGYPTPLCCQNNQSFTDVYDSSIEVILTLFIMLLGVTSPTKLLEVKYNMAIIKYLWNNNFPSNMKFIEENNIYMKKPKESKYHYYFWIYQQFIYIHFPKSFKICMCKSIDARLWM